MAVPHLFPKGQVGSVLESVLILQRTLLYHLDPLPINNILNSKNWARHLAFHWEEKNAKIDITLTTHQKKKYQVQDK